MPNVQRSKQAQELNAAIDACLLAPLKHPPHELAMQMPRLGVLSLVERVRRRAALLSRRDRAHADTILATRNALTLALYAGTASGGAFAAWSDGSSKKNADGPVAGIGGLVMAPDGRIVARLSRARRGLDAFAAEIAALQSVMQAAARHGAARLCVFTDCIALQRLWLEKRTDPRLARVNELARGFRRFDLRALPRLHNQAADRLARQALSRAAGLATGNTYTDH